MNILQIGTGGCGNKLINTLINITNKRLNLINTYDYLFINSNDNEVKCLPNSNNSNSLILQGNGTGRDRKKAKKSIELDKSKFLNHFNKISDKYDSYEIYFSADGGFGSGSIVGLCSVIRQINPKTKINLRFAFPKVNSRKLSLQNAVDLYYDVVKMLKSGIINSITIINNDKMNDEDKFNTKCMTQLLDALEFHGSSIDENDAFKVNCSDKYRLCFNLREDLPMDDAVELAIKQSPFVVPDNITSCSHLCGLLNKNNFHKDDPMEIFLVKDFDKTDYSTDGRNSLLIGGIKMPNNYITNVERILSQIDNVEDIDDDLDYKPSIKNEVQDEISVEDKKETKLERLQNMITDDFWNI